MISFGFAPLWTTLIAGVTVLPVDRRFEQRLPSLIETGTFGKKPHLDERFYEIAPDSISQLLQSWGEGDRAALDRPMPLVDTELRRMARRYMWQQPDRHTLQTTALIHEAYLRLVGPEGKCWKGRAHFFGVAAQRDAPHTGGLCPRPAYR